MNILQSEPNPERGLREGGGWAREALNLRIATGLACDHSLVAARFNVPDNEPTSLRAP